VAQEADVEITQSVASRLLKQRMSRKHAWDGIERNITIMVWEAVVHVDVVEIEEDSTTVNIGLESTLRIRIGHFRRKSMRDCVRVDTSHGWQMCVGIMVVVCVIIATVVVADVVVVVVVQDVRFHFWNMCHRKDQQRRNKALRCSINVAVTLELVSVVAVMGMDQIADLLPRCYCG
jgi:hypothetical protein